MVSLKDVFMEYYYSKNIMEEELNMSVKRLYEEEEDTLEEDYYCEEYEEDCEEEENEEINTNYEKYDYADYYYEGVEYGESDLDIFEDWE
jgi:hypothetical protein